MGRQGNDHLVIDVLPLWMVVPFLGPDRRAGHPAESIREIIELEGFDDCYVMLSGGSDSQFMLRLLKHFNIKFKAITYKTLWQGGIVNTDDIVYAREVAEKFNVDLKIVDFNSTELIL